MRVVIQRVMHASVHVDSKRIAYIQRGMLVLLGITHDDEYTDIEWLVKKIANLRIFDDENGIMNLSLIDIKGEILVVSQFTLFASTKKGNRPSYISAAKPDYAENLYHQFIEQFQKHSSITPKTGLFGADMQVELLNSGPVTIIIDSKIRE